jgi:hypothetical protein
MPNEDSTEARRDVRAAVRGLLARLAGYVAGPLLAVYGLWALAARRTFLPGQTGGTHFVQGRSGQALAAAYFCLGLFLVLRLAAEPRVRTDAARRRLMKVQSVLLGILIAALIFVLVSIGEVK